MMVLVSYDVSTRDDAGRRRLRRVARLCEDHGQRVQNSVFECGVDAAQWTVLRASLMSEASSTQDSLRFYFLGTEWRRRVEHVGAKLSYDPEAPLILSSSEHAQNHLREPIARTEYPLHSQIG